MTSTQKGFLCYVHADDDRDAGRLVQVVRDIVEEFEMLTTEPIDLFIDRDSIRWGDVWRDTIDGSLADVAFFIPMVTPRFLKSPECRREFETFERQAVRLGVDKLILPIMYVDVPGLSEMTDDRVAVAIERIQYETWSHLRYVDRGSAAYREAVGRVANELVSRLADVDSVDPLAQTDVAEETDESTWLEAFAEMEAAMPSIQGALEGINLDVPAIGQELDGAAEKFRNASGTGATAAARLSIARQLALALDPHVESLEKHASTYSESFAEIDAGVRIMLEQVRERFESDEGVTEADQSLVSSVRSLVGVTKDQYRAIAGARDAMEPAEKFSRDLKPRIRRIRGAMTQMGDAHSIANGWSEVLRDLPGKPPEQGEVEEGA